MGGGRGCPSGGVHQGVSIRGVHQLPGHIPLFRPKLFSRYREVAPSCIISSDEILTYKLTAYMVTGIGNCPSFILICSLASCLIPVLPITKSKWILLSVHFCVDVLWSAAVVRLANQCKRQSS